MTDKIVKGPAASIRAKLLAHAKQRRDDFGRVLTRYAIERLLFRLSRTEAAQRYVLKGAMLFVTWPQHGFRPTGDLDLLGQGDPDPAAITELFTQICQVEFADDGIVFDPATLKVEPVREGRKVPGRPSEPERETGRSGHSRAGRHRLRRPCLSAAEAGKFLQPAARPAPGEHPHVPA